MFAAKTLFILGAGASEEVGFPLGLELVEIIRDMVNVRQKPDRRYTGAPDLISDVAKTSGQSEDRVLTVARGIAVGIGFADSVDDYLDLHRADKLKILIAKAAIVRAILEREAESKLLKGASEFAGRVDSGELKETWFVRLMRMFARGVAPEQLFQDASFISFNYDRSLEYFLWHAIRALYGLSDQETTISFKKARISHPYGVIAQIPQVGLAGAVPFGDTSAPESAVSLAENIVTYSEELDRSDFKEMTAQVEAAQTVVFLGFGFRPQNVRLLTPSNSMRANKIFATAFGNSLSNRNDIVSDIHKMVAGSGGQTRDPSWGQVRIEVERELKCASLLDAFSKSLAN